VYQAAQLEHRAGHPVQLERPARFIILEHRRLVLANPLSAGQALVDPDGYLDPRTLESEIQQLLTTSKESKDTNADDINNHLS